MSEVAPITEAPSTTEASTTEAPSTAEAPSTLPQHGLTPEELEELRQAIGVDPLTVPIPVRRPKGRPRGRNNAILFCPFAAAGRPNPCNTYPEGTTTKNVRYLFSCYSC